MSQAGIVDIEGSHPQIPTFFVTNSGIAIPIANTLEILGAVVAADGVPLQTVASGNTITIEAQYASASASSSGTKAGLASFSSAYFSVDANGFVTLSGTGAGETITGNTGGPLAPLAGNWNILGISTAAGTIPVQTAGSGNTLTVEVQKSQAIASTNATNVGLAAFNSSEFTVDANGFVSLTGTGAGETITGNSGGALSPTSGNWNILGTGSITTVGSVSTLTIELTGMTQYGVAIGGATTSLSYVGPSATVGQVLQSQGASSNPAYSTATYPSTTTINQILYSSSANIISGLATVNNGVLITSAAGVPSFLADGTTGQVLVATTGSPPSWGSITTGVSSVTGTANQILASPTTGAVVLSLIGPYTPATYTAHSVIVGEGTSSMVGVGPTANTGAVLQNNSGADPTYSTATYPSTSTINQILYSSAANVVSGLATANNATLTTGATGIPVLTAFTTNGQILIGSGSGPPIVATLTAGTGVTITNASNSVTIAATQGALAYTNVNHAASPYTVLTTDDYISVDCSAGVVTLNFPNAPTTYKTWIVKDRTGNAFTNNIVITTVSGVVDVESSTTYFLNQNFASVELLFNGTSYEVF